MTLPSAGWYPDPAGAPVDRWWDGAQWTPYTQLRPDPIQLEMLRAQRQAANNTAAIRSAITAVIVVAVIVYVIIQLNHNLNG